jgi:Inositol monophosphatase family
MHSRGKGVENPIPAVLPPFTDRNLTTCVGSYAGVLTLRNGYFNGTRVLAAVVVNGVRNPRHDVLERCGVLGAVFPPEFPVASQEQFLPDDRGREQPTGTIHSPRGRSFAAANDLPQRRGRVAEIEQGHLATHDAREFHNQVNVCVGTNALRSVDPRTAPGRLRDLGSACCEQTFVAANRLQATTLRGEQAHDVAAGVVIATEAGCQIAALDGERPSPAEMLRRTPIACMQWGEK